MSNLRKHLRERREYIYRKSIEDRDRATAERKRSLKTALDENTPIPAKLRKDAVEMQPGLNWEDEGGEGLAVDSRDDEYRWAGVEDPCIMLTTSRDPSSRLKAFAKEVKLLFPNTKRINRGNYELKEIVDTCRDNNVTDLIILHEHRGTPDTLVISHLPYGPTAKFNLSQVVMRHDIPKVGTMSEAYPHLLFNNFATNVGKRVMNVLKYLYPVPKEDSQRYMTYYKAAESDWISFRHHTAKSGPDKAIELTEAGPRFEMRLFKLFRGTVEAEDVSEVEWVLRPYMNTARKRTHL